MLASFIAFGSWMQSKIREEHKKRRDEKKKDLISGEVGTGKKQNKTKTSQGDQSAHSLTVLRRNKLLYLQKDPQTSISIFHFYYLGY